MFLDSRSQYKFTIQISPSCTPPNNRILGNCCCCCLQIQKRKKKFLFLFRRSDGSGFVYSKKCFCFCFASAHWYAYVLLHKAQSYTFYNPAMNRFRWVNARMGQGDREKNTEAGMFCYVLCTWRCKCFLSWTLSHINHSITWKTRLFCVCVWMYMVSNVLYVIGPEFLVLSDGSE